MGKTPSEFQDVSIEECLKKFQTDAKKGLSDEEAKSRLEKYGFNAIEEKKESLFKKVMLFFWGPIPWMIELAAIISGILERWPDFILIAALLLINAILGFIHELQAENAISALKNSLALKAQVLRSGKWKEIPAKELVPGDIISVKLGNIIPADIKLLEGEYLSVDQAALTGESLPVDKKTSDTAFSSTIVKLGEMVSLVTNTGMNTFFGKTAKLIQSAKTESHFQKAILNIGRFLIISTLCIVAVILVVSLYRMHYDENFHKTYGQIAIFLLVLVVAGIPVALPAVMSVTMAIGAHKMAKMKAIVSKLIAIEELAGMDILCSDKTGTLTKNQLTLGEIETFEICSKEELLLNASLASKIDQPDAIDNAILAGLTDKEILKKYKVTKFIPFDPVRKRTEANIEVDGVSFSVTKGAPQMILELTKSSPDDMKKYNDSVDQFASKGFRTLGVAKKDKENWVFLGIIPLFDPPREDTKETIHTAKSMGVEVKMVTGDHVAIAKEIAETLDLGTNIAPMEKVFDEKIPKNEQEQMLTSMNGFAEVFPEHKFQIVKYLQESKHTVGMTGDGVNDAPALKQADIGIAVSGATDAARSAADLVLIEPGLIVITKAIEEARKIFGRLKSYAMYRISETCRLLLFLLFSILAFDTQPLSAMMIILIALLNDIPIMTIAYDHMKVDPNPTSWNMREVLSISIGLAVVGVISTFGLYWIGLNVWMLDPIKCSTLAFMGILCGGNLTIYLTRNRGALFTRPLPQKTFFLATLFSQAIGTLVSAYGLFTKDFVGIGWKYVLYAWIYILIWFGICILTKLFLYYLVEPKTKHDKKFIEKTKTSLHGN
ncbi:MAG: Potassium-transporting ATPase ATP-binding subunit [Chlamydiia bacterium]|nr:Potassium-transporting ATPase ATP-binding subunit [Chlamydiia bacterium]